MDISKKSWHYRLLKFWDTAYSGREHFTYEVSGFPPKDLCTYMRSLIWAVFWNATVIACLPAYVYGWVMLFTQKDIHHVWEVFVILIWTLCNIALAGILVILLAVGVTFIYHYVDDVLDEYKYRRLLESDDPLPVKKGPSILKVWYRNLKEKTCVMLKTVE